MKVSKRQLRRIIREAITTVSDEDFDRITMPGYKGPQPISYPSPTDERVLQMTGYNVWKTMNDPAKYDPNTPEESAEAMWVDADFYNDPNFTTKQKKVVEQNEDEMIKYLSDTIRNVRSDKFKSGLRTNIHVNDQIGR